MNWLTALETQTQASTLLSLGAFSANILVAIGLGIIISGIFCFRKNVSQSLSLALALLPPAVSVVVMMVDGSIGAGLAVAGAFSLVRFRSAPGSARDILAVFVAMAVGLTCAMGAYAHALIFVAVILPGLLVIEKLQGRKITPSKNRTLRITVPEDLNYSRAFDSVFQQYAQSYTLITVKTSNMGSLYKLQYDLKLKDASQEKDFIDQLRIRNGNLEIVCGLTAGSGGDL